MVLPNGGGSTFLPTFPADEIVERTVFGEDVELLPKSAPFWCFEKDTGALPWARRPCRGDLAFPVSRITPFDAAALRSPSVPH